MPNKEEDGCISVLRNKLDASLKKIRLLEVENDQLKEEVNQLRTENALLQEKDADRRSMQLKKLQASICNNDSLQENQLSRARKADGLPCDTSIFRPEYHGFPVETKGRVPKPPPRPTCQSMSSKPSMEIRLPPAPPPPPLPSKLSYESIKAVRRVPEVVELYRYLTRKEQKSDARTGSVGIPVITNPREMIGEIENRSAYLLAIKSDVETHAEFIDLLSREVENAAYREISDLEAFVEWLDKELSYLVDERAVLKHFPKWPEKKADAMREAVFGYRDLKSLECEVSSFHVDNGQPALVSLKQIQALQDKLEHSVHNVERVRDSASKRYRDFKIPWEWMLNTGIISQLKLGSVKLAKEYMNRVVSSANSDTFSDYEELILQGVRFAFRVHQFAGGFNEECRQAFQEFKKLVGEH